MSRKIAELRPVLDAETIAHRVKDLASELDRQYGDEPLLLICVLKGAFIFFSDLVRSMRKWGLELDFAQLSSYGAGACPSGEIILKKDVSAQLAGRHVLIVEDIVDSGHSLVFLRELFLARKPLSLKCCALIDKIGRREVEVSADFVGFGLNDGFIVGYGLDYAEKFRNLPDICELVFED